MKFVKTIKCKLKLALLSLVAFASLDGAAAEHKITLLTCGTGEELYSAFGHSALMVSNVETGGSVIYNFGLFDFDTPNFYLKFIKGDLDYFLGTETPDWFFYVYTEEERSIVGQTLHLTTAQAERIMAELSLLDRPENSAYRYKFIMRNCTTALRDLILENIVTDREALDAGTGHSFRYYLNNYLTDRPWIGLGINFLFGANTDKEATIYQSMFLPEILLEGLAEIKNDGEPLVSATLPFNNVGGDRQSAGGSGRLLQWGCFVALAVIAFFNRSRYPAIVFFMLLGLLGLLLCFVSLFSSHEELANNFNILWCSPLYLVLALLLMFSGKERGRSFRMVSLVCAEAILFGTLILFGLWIAGVQAFNPLFLLSIVIAFLFFWRSRKRLIGKKQ